MENAPPEKTTKKKIVPSAPAPIPNWALRLRLAFEQAEYIDKRGKIDKKRIAEKFHVTPKAVEHWINGKREPRLAVIVEMADLTGCSTDWLLGRKGAAPFARDYKPASNDK